ncbi:hypothetical protein ANN_02961, partial [Periplaneta americana]
MKKTAAVLKDMRSENTAVDDRTFQILKTLTYEILDTFIMQMEVNFGDFESIQLVELLDPNHFIVYKQNFPSTKLNSLLNKYPFFNGERLENELINIYSDIGKHMSPQRLLDYIVLNDLESVYVEVFKLVRLFLMFPVTTVSSERSLSTLKRIKTYTMINERLSCLSTIAIEKKLVKELMSDQLFKDRVIDNFATKKTRRLELLGLYILYLLFYSVVYRPARQRRPDIQVYVPRAKRLSTGEQDKPVTSVPCMSSQHSSSPSLRTKGTKHSRTLTVPPQKTGSLTADQVQKNKSSHRLSTSGTESSMHCWNSAPQVKSNSDADSEDTYWTKNTRQSVDNNNQCSDFSLEMSDVEESDIVREEKTQKVSGSSASVNRKDDREVEEPEAAVVERGKRIIQRDSKSSSSSSTPAQSGRNSPTFQDVVGQLWQSSDSKNSSDTSESELVYQEKDIHNSTDIYYMEARKEPSNAKHNFSVTSLDTGRVSSPEDFSEHFLDDVDLGRNCRRRHSKSSSSSSTPKHSGRNTPSSVSDNGAQTWDYFSEIKNATNSSQNRVSNCEMDIQNPAECNSVSQECGLSGVSLSEDSGLIMSNAEDSDHFESCSDTIDEIKLVNDDEKFSNVYGDTSFSSSTGSDKLDGSTEKVSSKDIFLSDECRDCKKDNDECRVQEEQNRKNRRIFRGNFKSSDVLIISDPEPVTSTAVQVDSGTEKASSVNGVLNKKKKIRHKGETAASDVTRSPVKVESIQKRKSSPARAPVTLNPDECTWDMMFDDNGDCLDPKLMEELSSSVGSVTIEKPQSDYRSFQSKVEQMMSGEADDEFSHVLEIYNFPAEFKTHDLYAVFSPYITRGFEIKWVDDTHALGVFSSSLVG